MKWVLVAELLPKLLLLLNSNMCVVFFSPNASLNLVDMSHQWLKHCGYLHRVLQGLLAGVDMEWR